MRVARAGSIWLPEVFVVLLAFTFVAAAPTAGSAELPGTVWVLSGKATYGLSGERSERDSVSFRVTFVDQGVCQMEVITTNGPPPFPCSWIVTSNKGFALVLDPDAMAAALGGTDGLLSEVVKKDPKDVTVDLPLVKNSGKGTVNPKQPKISMTYAMKGTATILGHSKTRNFHVQINVKGGLAP